MKFAVVCVLLFGILLAQPTGAETRLDLNAVPAGLKIPVHTDVIYRTSYGQ